MMNNNARTCYSFLEKSFLRISSLEHATSILGWDEAVMMPSGSGEARAESLAELKVIKHETLKNPQLLEWIQIAETDLSSLNSWQRANLREMKHLVLNAKAVTGDLVESISLANSRCEQAWRSFRQENNWKDFLPLMEKVIKLSREESLQRSEVLKISPYDALLDQFNPGLSSAQIDSVFNPVKSFLPSLIDGVIERQKSMKLVESTQIFPEEQQKFLGIELMEILGFDFNRGRLDVSHHPFCGGVSRDVRMTTRYDSENFVESLMGVIHETGHACYEQGLPQDWISQPVGMARGMMIHESQSLFFENIIGRHPKFLNLIRPMIIKYLAGDHSQHEFWSNKNIFCLLNKVKKTLIRTQSDEVTYPAHVILRYEIERDLFSHVIEPKDIPEIWNEKMKSYLGLSTDGNYKDGCMQDVHWPSGAFGYFPSYSLGAMSAAQFLVSIEKTIPQFHQSLENGHILPILQWLKSHIWSQGSLLTTNDLLIHATGETLNPYYFKRYIEGKYLESNV